MIVSSCSPVPGEGWVDLAARCGRGRRAEPQDRCRTSRCQFATVDRVHDVLLVALDVRAAACSDASGTMLRLFENHGRQEPHQRTHRRKPRLPPAHPPHRRWRQPLLINRWAKAGR
jgi:hypothetical protein